MHNGALAVRNEEENWNPDIKELHPGFLNASCSSKTDQDFLDYICNLKLFTKLFLQVILEMTLAAQPPSLLSTAERLHSIRKLPRRTKEDFLREVMMHSTAEKQELKEWWDSEKRDRKENVAHQKEATEWLLNIMERQVDTL
ncbi:hypothetical protein KIL84_017298 [Mauremys mutica]|uniref:Uncharacterized protein n=1 Tax=Mauremys mutica TaxID=74926 RepID=A0A9D4AXB1_9SAUR|nr:hypothetical protein KIL84_017298 [Mauremys mutica]